MPAMRITILSVDGDVTPLKFRAWLRKEAIDIQSTARSVEDIITVRLFITEKLRFAITQVKLDKMLKAIVDKHPNIYRVELEARTTALTLAEIAGVTEAAQSDLQRMVNDVV